MSKHLFPADITYRHDHDNPESFLTVGAAILAALVILIALAMAVAVAFGAVMGIFMPTSPSIPTPDRLDVAWVRGTRLTVAPNFMLDAAQPNGNSSRSTATPKP